MGWQAGRSVAGQIAYLLLVHWYMSIRAQVRTVVLRDCLPLPHASCTNLILQYFLQCAYHAGRMVGRYTEGQDGRKVREGSKYSQLPLKRTRQGPRVGVLIRESIVVGVYFSQMSIIYSLNFIRLLQVVFSSQQCLNQPAVNAILPENQVVILIG